MARVGGGDPTAKIASPCGDPGRQIPGLRSVASNSPIRWFRPAGMALALAGLAALVYWPVLTFDFVRWDDDINITQNPLLTAPWSWQLVGQLFAGRQALRFEPLHWLFFRLLHALFGFNPLGWHAFGLGLHLGATVLFYLVLREVGRLLLPATEPWRVELGAWLGAAVWAVHPLRAEAVAWVTASTYPETTVSLLASFWCYLQASADPTRWRRWLGLTWVLAVAATASYPVGITYALWLIAVDCWLLPATPGRPAVLGSPASRLSRAWCAKHAAFLVPAVLGVGFTLWSRFMTPGMWEAPPSLATLGLSTRLGMALASLTTLVEDLLWPSHLTPNLQPLVLQGWVQWQVVFMAVLVLALAWDGRRRHPGRTLFWLGFAALALPCLGWTERPKWPVDRYSYLVDLVLVGGAAVWLLRWAGGARARRVVVGTGAAVLVLGGAWATRRQIMIWRDSPALFLAMEQDPGFAESPRMQGNVYFKWSAHEAASIHRATAVRLFNEAQQVFFQAIRAAVARGDYAEALALSVQLDYYAPLSPILHRERGAWLLRLGRPADALAELQLARPGLKDDPRLESLLGEAQK